MWYAKAPRPKGYFCPKYARPLTSAFGSQHIKMNINKDWLICRKTPDEFELEALKSKASAFNIPLEKVIKRFSERPFGNITDRWNEFRAKVKDDDELWYFSTPDHMNRNKMGCKGYAIIRKGEIVETLVVLRT